MKYDHTKKTNRFAARTLKDFSTTMFSLLKDKPFESITVLQICQIANYPRATFYNYFEDKYDLLEYCWSLIKDQIRLEEALDICHPHETFELFGRLYDCFKEHEKLLTKIMTHNPVEGELFASFTRYLSVNVLRIVESLNIQSETIPLPLAVSFYSNTIMLVLEYCFLEKKRISKEQAMIYLRYLLIKESTKKGGPL